jgi:hypothetical protein
MSFGGGQETLGLLPASDQGQVRSVLRSEPCWCVAVLCRSLSIGTCTPVLASLCFDLHRQFCTVNSAGTTCCQSVGALKGL